MSTKQITLSASMSVRRIIDGDTLSLYFTTNGVALFQGVNPDSGSITPSWSDDITGKKCPVITPHVGSARKQAVSLVEHKWSYNGVDITFATGTGWVKSTNFNGKFKLNTADGSLAIIGNLAEKDKNEDSDSITYTGMASVGSASYEMSKSIDVLISMLGGSAYVGGINATSTAIGSTDENGNYISTSTLTFFLNNASGAVTSFSVKLYRGAETEEAASTNTPSTGITIHRDKTDDKDKLYVDSHQFFVAEFYVPGVGTPVFRAGISIDDMADLYDFKLYSTDTGVGNGKDFTAKCQVVNTKTGTVATMGKGTIVFNILRGDGTLKVVRSSTVNFANNTEFQKASITVKESDTKATENGKTTEFDVTLNCDLNGEVIVS